MFVTKVVMKEGLVKLIIKTMLSYVDIRLDNEINLKKKHKSKWLKQC